MDLKPFMVWHSSEVILKEMDLLADEGGTFFERWGGSSTDRYLVMATSHLEAARSVQADKKSNGRLFPREYFVSALKTGIDEYASPVKELTSTMDLEYASRKELCSFLGDDVDTFEALFHSARKVQL